MGVTTPWCPRCGAWRGYVAMLCKGCVAITNNITNDMLAAKREALIEAAQVLTAVNAPEAEKRIAEAKALTEPQLHSLVERDLVRQRFEKISEMRTDREAFTQALEEMVEQNVEQMKALCYDWMRMRPESRRVRFANMYALELVTVARAALEEMGALSLELSKFTENTPRHEETMQRIAAGMQTVEKFIHPDANEPEQPAEENDGMDVPGQEEQ